MKSLLNAMQDGRLIELPDNNKEKALEYLSAIIEAIPDVSSDKEITERVLARESNYNTGIGNGWACPHVRTRLDGSVLSAVGWSPQAIDYGSGDGKNVHIVVLYYVPDAQKNTYLKEISLLAKAIMTRSDLQDLKSLNSLSDVRDRLLNAISMAVETCTPDAKARMIQLETKQQPLPSSVDSSSPFDLSQSIIPLSILTVQGMKPLVLSQNHELTSLIESNEKMNENLSQKKAFDCHGYRILFRSESVYQENRTLYECLAIKLS